MSLLNYSPGIDRCKLNLFPLTGQKLSRRCQHYLMEYLNMEIIIRVLNSEEGNVRWWVGDFYRLFNYKGGNSGLSIRVLVEKEYNSSLFINERTEATGIKSGKSFVEICTKTCASCFLRRAFQYKSKNALNKDQNFRIA